MGWIAPAVARDSRVCVYDRAGGGWSDLPTDHKTPSPTGLDTLLDRGHIPGPYVLTGHSFGGLYVLTFAATYPDQVAGLVLLDSTAPVPGPVPPTKAGSSDLVGRISALLPPLAHLGAANLIGDSYDSLPHAPGTKRAPAGQPRTPSRATSTNSLWDRGRRTKPPHLSISGSKPLIVVTAGREHDAAWMAAPDKLATLSTNSRHDIVAEARTPRLY
jgi:pimeloyl-ACP methyl ester carboxylesterase